MIERDLSQEKDNIRYVRWQQFKIDQMGKVISLVVGLATFNLGFLLNFIGQSNLTFEKNQKLWLIITILAVIISIISGIIVSITRLYDYRFTARTVGIDEGIVTYSNKNSDHYRKITNKLGKYSWGFLWVQLISFVVGLGMTVLTIICLSF
jgi:hypothetical protein